MSASTPKVKTGKPAAVVTPATGSVSAPLLTLTGRGMEELKKFVAEGKDVATLHHPVVADEDKLEALVGQIQDESKEWIMRSRSNVIGTNISSLIASAWSHAALARASGNASAFIMDMMMAAVSAFTVSEIVSDIYDNNREMSMFAPFEIKERASNPGMRGSWVTGSQMNGTALRMFGQALAYSAPASSAIGEVHKAKGSMFNPPDKEVETDYAKLCRENQKAISREDKDLVKDFFKEFPIIFELVDHFLGGSAGDITAIADFAKSMENCII